MKCLRENKFENALCRHESKEYLECRMERQVRAPPRPRPAPPPPARPASTRTLLSQRPLRPPLSSWGRGFPRGPCGAGACARELLPRDTPRGRVPPSSVAQTGASAEPEAGRSGSQPLACVVRFGTCRRRETVGRLDVGGGGLPRRPVPSRLRVIVHPHPRVVSIGLRAGRRTHGRCPPQAP